MKPLILAGLLALTATPAPGAPWVRGFAVERYEEIVNAWIEGLERRVAAGLPVDRLASVASFFVSRVDTKVDARLEKLGHAELQGMAAVANAKLAYEH